MRVGGGGCFITGCGKRDSGWVLSCSFFVWGGSFMLGFGWGDSGWISYFSYFLFCFCAVVNCSFMAGM